LSAPKVQKGLVPCLIHQTWPPAFPPPKSALYHLSIEPSILSLAADIFLLNSSFAASILTHPINTLCHLGMSVYLHPLSIPSRNNSMSDGSPYTQSTSPARSSTTSPSRRSSEGTHFLGIPGPSTPQIKDADSVDREANAAAAAAAATASSSPSSQGQCGNYSNLAMSLRPSCRRT